MGRCRWFIAAASAALLGSALLAACGSDNSKTSTSNTTAGNSGAGAYGAYGAGGGTTPTSAAAGPSVSVKTTAKGSVLVDANGMTLYRFDKDSGGTIACTGACAGTWPPATAPSGTTTVSAGAGVDQLTIVTRPDGALQVAHASHPLYRYSGDTKSGDTNGDGFGGVWHVELSAAASSGSTATTSATQAPYSSG